MEINSYQLGEIRAVVTSLYYLESETAKAGLKEVSNILRKTINEIEGWINTGSYCGASVQEVIIGYELYNILALLHKFSQNHKYDLPGILKAIESYDAQREKAS